ncbi:MAG: aminotransferase class IV [Clostridium sp.]|uniref:aminotransferase class IV n=1 Tax=Clostridium sp. TaxID=1506 RepID=UPI003F407578
MREIIIDNEKINLDSGLFFGKGLFETILVRKKPEFLDFHINRLNEGLKLIGLKKVKENIKEIIKKMNIEDRVLKIIVTEKNIILKTREIPYKKEDYEKGFNLCISKVLRNSTSSLNKIKSLNYLENILEREEALREGYNDCLFINEKGNICETSTGNIFFVKDKKIYSPSVEEGLLNGTIREFLIKECNVTLKNFKIKDLEFIDEIFMSNSIIGIMKIKSIGDYKFEKEDIFLETLQKYLDKVRGMEEGNE